MAKTMIASEQSITDGQIENVVARLRDALRKHRNELGSEPVQQVLGVENLGMELLEPFRKRIELVSNVITCHVKVDRTKTPQEVINATGRTKWYIDEEVLAEMPREGFKEGEVVIFELDYDPTVDELDREYEIRGLQPDPYAVAQVAINDPAFADERLLSVQWRDKCGRACCAIFRRFGAGREVDVRWRGLWWSRDCRFGGVRK